MAVVGVGLNMAAHGWLHLAETGEEKKQREVWLLGQGFRVPHSRLRWHCSAYRGTLDGRRSCCVVVGNPGGAPRGQAEGGTKQRMWTEKVRLMQGKSTGLGLL